MSHIEQLKNFLKNIKITREKMHINGYKFYSIQK